jgi:hypothetical protein
MEKLNFEKKLNEMEKPHISQLKHEDMLSNAIINARDKSVVSWWWLSVPLFIILMLLMKSTFMPGTTLISNMHELKTDQRLISVIFFLVSPLTLILVNALTIKKIHFLSGSPKSLIFLTAVWFNILIIAVSACILIIYSL